MNTSIRFKLFLMMVLEFFIWGAWLPLIFSYLPSLGFTATEQTWILSAFPIAAIVGMFFSNQFADRNFAAERFLSASHLVGGVAMLSLAWAKTFWPFFARDARALPALRPHDLDRELDRVHAHERSAEGIRLRANGRDHRVDSGRLALDLHPGGLGQSQRHAN